MDSPSGNHALKGTIRTSADMEHKVISKRFDTPLDLTNKPYVFSTIQIADVAANHDAFTVQMRVYSGQEVLRGEVEIAPFEWNTIALDLSSWAHRHEVDQMKYWVQPAERQAWSSGSIALTDIGHAAAAPVGPQTGEVGANGHVDLDEGNETIGNRAHNVHLNTNWSMNDHGDLQGSLRIKATPQGLELNMSDLDWIVIGDQQALFQGEAVGERGEAYIVRVHLEGDASPGQQPQQRMSLIIWEDDQQEEPLFEVYDERFRGSMHIHD